MRGIAVGPLDRLGATVVVSDVSSNLAREVRNGREDSTCDDIALDLGEPQFNLVEPGRVRRREVNVDLGTVIEEVADALGLMGREIVDDDVDLAPRRLAGDDVTKNRDELCGRVASGGLTEHLSALGVEGRIEGQRVVAEVLEPVALARPGEKGRTESSRSRAWIAVFSSTQKTAACCGGLT